MASFSQCILNNAAIHVIVEMIQKETEENAKTILGAFRQCIEKSVESPESLLSADVQQQEVPAMEE